MQRHSTTDLYPESCYDHLWCLKPPPMLWIAVIYLSRAITLPFFMGVGHVLGINPSALSAIRDYWSADSLIPSLIAAVIFYPLFRRVPSASRPVRWIWARGRIVLAISALLDIALQAIAAIHQGEVNNAALFAGGSAVLDLYFLLYILATRRVRHVFSEFPEP
jgi:hypothetical protein